MVIKYKYSLTVYDRNDLRAPCTDQRTATGPASEHEESRETGETAAKRAQNPYVSRKSGPWGAAEPSARSHHQAHGTSRATAEPPRAKPTCKPMVGTAFDSRHDIAKKQTNPK
jgi:hypothetical protein